MQMIWYILAYICLMSIWAFCLMGVDKWRAKKKRWRVSERTLFLVAVFGGALGAVLGMYHFHHKTKHWQFRLGLPLLLMVQALLFALLAYFYLH